MNDLIKPRSVVLNWYLVWAGSIADIKKIKHQWLSGNRARPSAWTHELWDISGLSVVSGRGERPQRGLCILPGACHLTIPPGGWFRKIARCSEDKRDRQSPRLLSFLLKDTGSPGMGCQWMSWAVRDCFAPPHFPPGQVSFRFLGHVVRWSSWCWEVASETVFGIAITLANMCIFLYIPASSSLFFVAKPRLVLVPKPNPDGKGNMAAEDCLPFGKLK